MVPASYRVVPLYSFCLHNISKFTISIHTNHSAEVCTIRMTRMQCKLIAMAQICSGIPFFSELCSRTVELTSLNSADVNAIVNNTN